MVKDIIKELSPIFYPKTYAVIGASSDKTKWGAVFLKALLGFGYKGKVFPVNSREKEIMGLPAYPRVTDIPEAIDFATIATPAASVPAIVEECRIKGIKAVQIITAGFKELSPEGGKLEEQLAEIAKKGIRIIGPNCFGVYCPESGVTVLPGEHLPKEPGSVGLICQSGNFTTLSPRIASGWGIRFSKAVSYGNACDINECDLLEYLAQDPATKIIVCYIEGAKDGPRFFKLVQQTSKIKPVIMWKAGLTVSGARAVRSHTASLAGQKATWDAFFKQTGAISVNSLEELNDTLLAFYYLAPHKGRRVGILGGSGAISVTAADTCERMGISMPPFSEETSKKIAAIVPVQGSSNRNPIDLGGPKPNPEMFKSVMETVLSTGEVDTLVVDGVEMYGLDTAMNKEEVKILSRVPVEIKNTSHKKVVIVLPVETTEVNEIEVEKARREMAHYYLKEGIPIFLTLERAAKALAHLADYYDYLDTNI